LQCDAVCCSVAHSKHVAEQQRLCKILRFVYQDTATHCNTLQHAAKHCNTLHPKTLQNQEILM